MQPPPDCPKAHEKSRAGKPTVSQLCTIFARMKARHILTFIAGSLVASAYFASCGVDRWAAYAEQTASDRWIDDTMRVWYYWNEEMPGTDEVNYFQPPFTFFASLLSKEDKFSTIDSLEAETRSIPYTGHSYGFQFTTNRVEGNDTALYAHILYVAPGSPADDIGLERGDWLLEMDGQPITSRNQAALYGSGAMRVTVGYYDAESGAVVAYREEPRNLAAARAVDDNPVHYAATYELAGKRIGYLVYNHFSAGATTGGEYNNDLRNAFSLFASRQVDEFILDLRYNNGGLVTCAQLLCTMLAPASALDQPLGYLEYNSRTNPQETALYLDRNLIQNGANLNLRRLYVLTSSQTASASELLINCLRPYMEVILVGGTTVGKNVGSLTFENREQLISISPIVCKIYNAERESDYEAGFPAQYAADENNDPVRFLPFGNPEEALLNAALGIIAGEAAEEGGEEAASPANSAIVTNSIERRADRAVRLQ